MTLRSGDEISEWIDASLQHRVWRIVLRRPQKRNALTMAMFAALADSLAFAESCDGVRAIAITGEGDVFCAGHDLDAFDAWPQQPDDPVPRFLHALASVHKPLVIGVQGAAAGVGATMLLHADWVIATPGARLRFPFIDLGIAPEAASSLLLARSVGTLRAKHLLLGGEPFTAEAAERWGLVTEISAVEDLPGAVLERARLLGAKDPAVYGRIKAWLTPIDAVRQRIDEEVAAINDALVARKGKTS
jgi:enoyl-CoA hydratase/carnithine racemase